jgi:hypothetical protein
MITDAELGAAIADRERWRPTGPGSAVFAVPGAPLSVRVARVHHQTKREEFVASVVGRGGTAMYTMPFYDAHTAVVWAESVRPAAGHEPALETSIPAEGA